MKVDIEWVKNRLRDSGVKATSQRLAVFQILAETKKHPNAETIFEEVKKTLPGISLATVYSTLKQLQKTGLIQEISTDWNIKRYDGNPDTHPHMICIRCKKVEDLEEIDNDTLDNLESFVTKKTDYRLLKSYFNFYGYCPGCQRGVKKGGGRNEDACM